MQKNWYIVYTKPKCEKKVVSLLTKRKIENYCPLNGKKFKHTRKTKLTYEPLFNSYVFVNVYESEIYFLKEIENVLSLLYWKGSPAIIANEDIKAIKDFTFDHVDIKLQKNRINAGFEEKSIDASSYKMDGKILMIKNRTFSVNLPSLGFTLTAEIEIEKNRGIEISFGNKELRLQS